jgi:Zn-dependent protease with chaperone function
VIVGITAGIIVVALMIYWLLPSLLVRRRCLVEIPLNDMPAVRDALASLCVVSGVERVTFLVDTMDRRRTGLAFGRPRRRYVVLSRGLLLSASNDPTLFRAVVLHELAHIANGDLDRTFLTVALWRAFVALAVVPATLLIVLQLIVAAGLVVTPLSRPLDMATDLQVGWRLVVLVVLVLLIRNRVLRSRELSADVRAAQWGDGERLQRLFADLADRQPAAETGWLGATARRFVAEIVGVLRVHPAASARLGAIDDPTDVMNAGLWDGLTLGITASLGLGSMELTESWLNLGLSQDIPWMLAAILGFASCVLVFRVVVAGKVAARPTHVNRFAVALGVGLIAGTILDLHSATLPPGVLQGGQPGPGLLTWLVWIALAIGVSVLFVQWLRRLAEAWMAVVSRTASPTVAVMLCGVLAALVLGFWLPPLLDFPGFVTYGQQVDLIGQSEIATIVFTLDSLPLLYAAGLLATLTAQWAFPFAALFFTRDGAQLAPAWASLGPTPGARLLAKPELRPLTAAKTGLIVGAVGVGILVLPNVLVVGVLPWDPVLGTMLFGLPLPLAALAMLVSAVRSSSMETDARSLHGLLSASVASLVLLVAGLVQAAGICDLRGLCGPPAPLLWPASTIMQMLAASLLIAYVAASIVSAVQGWRTGLARPQLAGAAEVAVQTRVPRPWIMALLGLLPGILLLGPVTVVVVVTIGVTGTSSLFVMIGAVSSMWPSRRILALTIGLATGAIFVLLALDVGSAIAIGAPLPASAPIIGLDALLFCWAGAGYLSVRILRHGWRRIRDPGRARRASSLTVSDESADHGIGEQS